MKKVSVVLPVFNGEDYLAKSVESVLQQTYTDLELIIVDDKSKDRTPEIIKEYAAKDKRVIAHRNKKNLKLPRALNVGFLKASGEYRTWTSHDNLYAKDAIEKMVAALEAEPEAVLVCADMEKVNRDGEHTGEIRLREPEDIYLTNTVGACFLYRHEKSRFIGGYDTELFLAEDYDYWIRLSKQGPFIHLPEILYTVREHEGSLSSTKAKESNKQYVKVVKKHFKYLYDSLDTMERKDQLVNELMNRSNTFFMRLGAISTIGKRRAGYGFRVLHGRLVSLFGHGGR